MIRQVIVPLQNTYLLHLPDNLVGKKVEVIAFSDDDVFTELIGVKMPEKRTVEQAIEFYKKNAIDFSKLEKWKREDLYE